MLSVCVENISSGDLIFFSSAKKYRTASASVLGKGCEGMEVNRLHFLSISSTCHCYPVNPHTSRGFSECPKSENQWCAWSSGNQGTKKRAWRIGFVPIFQLLAAFWDNQCCFYLISTVCVAGWRPVTTNLEIFYCKMWGIEFRVKPWHNLHLKEPGLEKISLWIICTMLWSSFFAFIYVH